MTTVRVLVGTKKGAFILTSDGKRNTWKVDGPHFAGWEIYHMKGSPADPNRIYASQSSGWFGQIMQRSDDGGKTWFMPGSPPPKQAEPAGPAHDPTEPTTGASTEGMPKGESNKFVYNTDEASGGAKLTTHQWYDGTQHPWEFKRVWHVEPSPSNPDVAFAGVEDAAIFKTIDGGKTWNEMPGLRGHGTGPQWSPGAGGLGTHTILIDPRNENRMYCAISAAGAFRSDDGAKTWKPINKGLHSDYIPDPNAQVGHCVHRIAFHPSNTDTVYMQKHWDVLRTDNAGEQWHEVSGNLPSDFGFPIDVHAHEPETIYVVPILSDSLHYPPEGKLRVYRNKTGGRDPRGWEPLTNGLPQQDCYHNILRDAMCVDTMDPCGIYFGTTGGQVYASPNGGDTWQPIVSNLPSVLSVEVQVVK